MEWPRRISWSVNFLIFLLCLFLCAAFLSASPSLDSYLASRLDFGAVPRGPRASVNDVATVPAINNVAERDVELITPDVTFDCASTVNGLVYQFEDTLFLLSGNQLFRLNVNSDKKRLDPLVTFAAFTEVVLGFSVQPMPENVLIVAVAFPTHYNVYKKVLPAEPDDRMTSFKRKVKSFQKLPINYLAGLRPIKILLFRVKNELNLFRAETSQQNSSTSLT